MSSSAKRNLEPVATEKRGLPRKKVLFSGVIADTTGKNEIDCTIRDITVRGAQVQVSRTLGCAELYLVNTRSEIAHLASVAWVKGDRAGLSFVRSYLLDASLPPQLEFLRTLLIEARLNQVHALIRWGVPVEEATRVVGLSEECIERFATLGPREDRLTLLLHQAKRLIGKTAPGTQR
jgi:hypothetical protein